MQVSVDDYSEVDGDEGGQDQVPRKSTKVHQERLIKDPKESACTPKLNRSKGDQFCSPRDSGHLQAGDGDTVFKANELVVHPLDPVVVGGDMSDQTHKTNDLVEKDNRKIAITSSEEIRTNIAKGKEKLLIVIEHEIKDDLGHRIEHYDHQGGRKPTSEWLAAMSKCPATIRMELLQLLR